MIPHILGYIAWHCVGIVDEIYASLLFIAYK